MFKNKENHYFIMMEVAIDPLMLTILGAFISAGLGMLGWRIKVARSKKAKHIDDVQDLRKAVWRLNKTVIIMAKMLDGLSKKAHPELETELEEIARELLSTSDDYDEDS